MCILEKIIYILATIMLLVIIAVSHLDLDKRVKVLEQERLEQVEKEKSVVGYWTWNPQYCQYFYEAKL